MAQHPENAGRRGHGWRIAAWSAAAGLLALPWIAQAPWTLFDYLLMGGLLGGAGLLLELAMRASGSLAYRAGAGVAVAGAFLLAWVNGAVGFLGSEDNPANLMFIAVLAVGITGAVLAGFQSAGMAKAMLATAAAQASIGLFAVAARMGATGDDGLYEAVMGTGLFAALWLISAGLFRKAEKAVTLARSCTGQAE